MEALQANKIGTVSGDYNETSGHVNVVIDGDKVSEEEAASVIKCHKVKE